MDNFNKIVSFVLGLVVIVVFLAVITGRFNLKQKIPLFSSKPTPTPTQVVLPSPTISANAPTGTYMGNNSYNKANPSSIPSTGAPTALLPLLLGGLTMGVYLRKRS